MEFILKSENAEYFPVMAKMVEANIELPVNKPAFLPFNFEDRFLYDGSPVDYLFCPPLILAPVSKSAKAIIYDVDLSLNVKKSDGIGQLRFIFGKSQDYKPTPGFNPNKMKSIHFTKIE